VFRQKEKNVFREQKKSKMLPLFVLLLAGLVVFVPYYIGQVIESVYREQKQLVTNTFNIKILNEHYEKHWFYSVGELQTHLPFEPVTATMQHRITHKPIVLDPDVPWLPKLEYATINTIFSLQHPDYTQNGGNSINIRTGVPDRHYARSSVERQSLFLNGTDGKPMFSVDDLVANVLLLHEDNQITGGLTSSSLMWKDTRLSALFHNVSLGFNFLSSGDSLLTEGDLSYSSDSARITLGNTALTINNIWGYYISILDNKSVNIKKHIEFRELNNGFLVIGPGSMEVQLDKINSKAVGSIPNIVSLFLELKSQADKKTRNKTIEQLRTVLNELIPEQATLRISNLNIAMPGGSITGDLTLALPALNNTDFNQWLNSVTLDANLSMPIEEIHKYVAAASDFSGDEIQEFMDDYVADGFVVRNQDKYLALARLRNNQLSFNGKPYSFPKLMAP